MALTKNQIRDLYRKRSANYDLSANLYYLIGFREIKYRKLAVSALRLRSGDTVVEIGCGTGLNFKYLVASIGSGGRLIGVDLTDAMLAKGNTRVERHGWENIELVQSDAASYAFPSNLNAVISTFALTLVPEYETVIEHAACALSQRGRLVILDLKKPDNCPSWLLRLGVGITKPFGVTLDLTHRKPWETLGRYFPNVSMQEVYGGFGYIAVGQKSLRPQ